MSRMLSVHPVADELGVRFAAAGHQLFLVGGSVRDALLGRLGSDLDFATDARPDRIRQLVTGWADDIWDTGAAYGTVGLRRGDARLEVTTFRSDAYRVDSRKPQVEFGDDIDADLARRDFTVNAMAVSLPDRDWRDPHGGARDLAARRLRTPATPEASFSDDPLRILRAARFVAQLGFEVDPDVRTAMSAMADRLGIVSAERIRDELSRLLCSDHPRAGLALSVETGVADVVLPELPRLRMERDPVHRHKDVYEHTLTVLEQAIALEPDGPDLVLRLAALLHDVGKPATRSVTPDGTVTFHLHEVVGKQLTRARLTALRYPNEVVKDVSRLVELHLRFHGYADGEGWTDSAVRRYVRDAGPLLPRLHRLVRSDCTTRNPRKAAALAAAYDSLERRIDELRAKEELDRIRPDLDGNEVMSLLGLAPGPTVGRAREYLLNLRLERGPLPREEAVAELFRWAREQGLPVPS
jgi:poly(A) polymerase